MNDTSLTVFNDGRSLNVFGVADGGVLERAQQIDGHPWTPFTAIGPTVFPAPWTFTGNIVGYSIAGELHLFGVGSDGYVHEYVYTAASNTWTLQPTITVCHFNSGTPLSISSGGGSVNILGVLPDGDLGQDARNSGSSVWYGGDNTPLGPVFAPATPLAFRSMNGVYDIFGVNPLGNITHIQFNSTQGWFIKEIVSESGNNLTSGSPLTIYEGTNGSFDLFGVNQNGQVVQAQYNPGSGWGGGTNPNSNGLAPNSQPSLYYDPSTGHQEVYAMFADGEVADLEFSGGWTQYDLG